MKIFIFSAAAGVNICGNDRAVRQEQDWEGTGWCI